MTSAMRRKKMTDCPKCYGTPCVCEDIKIWIPVWHCYMWVEKENLMIPIGDIPMNPKTKRMWDNGVPLK